MEITVNSHAVIQNNTKRSHISITQFPLMVTSYKTTIPYYNQSVYHWHWWSQDAGFHYRQGHSAHIFLSAALTNHQCGSNHGNVCSHKAGGQNLKGISGVIYSFQNLIMLDMDFLDLSFLRLFQLPHSACSFTYLPNLAFFFFFSFFSFLFFFFFFS